MAITIEQIYTGCLAQGAYYIQCGNEAAIIDPLREVSPYLEKAARQKATIRYVLETHFHADFVSGHLDLARATGATIVYGPTARPRFNAHIAADGEMLPLGNGHIQVLHTPGHTLESVTFLLINAQGRPQALFTGDTVLLGNVGRPDLAQQAAGKSQEELAGLMYDSIRTKILPLPDDVMVYPGHGAGSACGKNMMDATRDTLGNQKKVNPALRAGLTRSQFILEATHGLSPPPAYFPENARMNQEGYPALQQVLKQGTRPLTPAELEVVANETGALVIDTRPAARFRAGFIPNSIHIGLNGAFAPWVGALVPGVNHPLLIIADEGREQEVVTRLARVGYDQALGYLQGGLAAWTAAGHAIDTVAHISAEGLAKRLKTERLVLLDVRKLAEYVSERLPDAIHAPLDYLNEYLAQIPRHETVYVYCASGYRSLIAISILKARGWNNLVDVAGGMASLLNTQTALASGPEQPTLLGRQH